MPATILIEPRWVIPVEPAATLLEAHAVAVEGRHIAAVLPAAEAVKRYPEAERIPLPGPTPR